MKADRLSPPDAASAMLARIEEGATIREAFEAVGGRIRFVNDGRRIHADCLGLTAHHTRSPSRACANWLH